MTTYILEHPSNCDIPAYIGTNKKILQEIADRFNDESEAEKRNDIQPCKPTPLDEWIVHAWECGVEYDDLVQTIEMAKQADYSKQFIEQFVEEINDQANEQLTK